MKTLLRLIPILFFISILNTSCKKDKDETPTPTPTTPGPSNLGWNAGDNPSQIPTSVTNIPLYTAGNLPSQVDLLPHFPPVGDQGQYGTCVAWASGYNMKTVIDGIKNNLGGADLASAANQTSPKDLYWSIEDSRKGSECQGTNFTDALDLLLNRGAATLQTVPYDNMGNCSASGVQSSWTNEANQRKIKNYRKIDPTVASIKEQLANNFPVVIGAKLSDNFMTWNSDAVYTANSTYTNVGIHAYHALIISGYDDSKGPNGAFQVVNSWSTNWGDVGRIWVDYNFMINEFSFDGNFYIATPDEGTTPPSPGPNPSSGVDMATWVFGDQSTYNVTQIDYINERAIYFNLYNIGNNDALSSSNWNLYYIYFNAFDANDYGVLFYDEFNTSIAPNTYQFPTPDHGIINIDIPSNNDLGTVAFGTSQLYQIYYNPPTLNGYYYLVLIADASGVFQENNESNNCFYTTSQLPKYFDNGYSDRTSQQSASVSGFTDYKFVNSEKFTPEMLKTNSYNTIVTRQNPNAYSNDEIITMLKIKKQTGDLEKKINRFKQDRGKGGFGGHQ